MIDRNIDKSTVAGFGDEWERFDQADLSPEERQKIFDSYSLTICDNNNFIHIN